MISSPKAFVHVSHVGINEKGVVEASKGLDPVWATLVGKLKGYSVAQHSIIQDDRDFGGKSLEGANASGKKAVKGEDREYQLQIRNASDHLVIAAGSLSEKMRGKRAVR